MLLDVPVDVDVKAEMIIALVGFQELDEPGHS